MSRPTIIILIFPEAYFLFFFEVFIFFLKIKQNATGRFQQAVAIHNMTELVPYCHFVLKKLGGKPFPARVSPPPSSLSPSELHSTSLTFSTNYDVSVYLPIARSTS